MGLVHNDQKIIGEVINQRTWRLSRQGPGQMSGIVLNSGAEPCLPHHFHIKIRPLRDSLGLQQFVLALKISHLLLQLRKNRLSRKLHLFF